MSDARWFDIDADIDSAVTHLTRAAELFRTRDMNGDELDAYMARMAFMHAVMAGHTSLENALTRILRLLGEEAPSGETWHADLIRRVSRASGDRPPILDADLSRAADRTRRFRHVAARGYDSFDPEEAAPAVSAAELLAARVPDAIARLRAAIDP
ncbi:MAG TPA: hypothetical protein VIZ17_00620 [Acetobacteraceae bacterium]